MKKDIFIKWNLLDSFFNAIDKTAEYLKDSISTEEPDAEYMIKVQTEHLSNQNERLKKLQVPRLLKKLPDNDNYYCPNCNIEILHLLVHKYKIKFCPECGQRIYTNITTSCREVQLETDN